MRNFKYTLMSDLHIDTGHKTKIKEWNLEEHVIIAGDTANGLVACRFINKLKKLGHKVFAIDGNHEHYQNREKQKSIPQTEADFFDNLAQPKIVSVADGVSLIGLNAWYDPYGSDDGAFWKDLMNDWHYTGDMFKIAEQSAHWLDLALQDLDGQAIIVTHTSPVLETLVCRKGDEADWDRINCFYRNIHMADVLKKHAAKILIWNHGHSHDAADMIVDGVRVIANPRGYPGQNPDWAPKSITIGLA